MILRTEHPDGSQSTEDLGKRYLINWCGGVPFENFLKQFFSDPESEAAKSVYAFLSYDNGGSHQPLLKGTVYYILSEGGRKFEKLAY